MQILCVVPTSFKFRKKARELGLDASALEPIVFKYQNSEETRGKFPPDDYIKKSLYGKREEFTRAALRMYQKKYSVPTIYTDLAQLNDAKQEAAKFFPQSSITSYKNSSGEYVLLVAEPSNIDNAPKSMFTTEDFDLEKEQKDLDWRSLYFRRELRRLPKGIRDQVGQLLEKYMDKGKNEKTHSIEGKYFPDGEVKSSYGLLYDISQNSEVKALRDLATMLLPYMNEYNNATVEFKEVDSVKPRRRGVYRSESNTISIYRRATKGATAENAVAQLETTIIHEIVHAITVARINESEEAREALGTLMSELKNVVDSNNFVYLYALKNQKEFVSEFLSNPTFREALILIPAKNGNLSIGQKILNWIKQHVFNIRTDVSLFDRIDPVIRELLNSSNIVSETMTNSIRQSDSTISSLREMQDIKRRAIADGTFMKAPNGKPTNLTERRWLHVRTENFKNWFGKWDTVNTFNTDIDTSEVDVVPDDKLWKEREDGKHLDEKGNWKSNKTLRFYLKGDPREGRDSKGYFELVKDEEFGQYSVHFKTNNGRHGSDVAASTREERAKLYKALIQAIPDGATVSTWGEVSIGGVGALDKVGRDLTKVGEREVTSKETGEKINIPVYQKGKGVSKVIDENGEPLVVYHGSPNNSFKVFDQSKGEATKTPEGTYFFTDNKDLAKTYGNTRAFFLNISDPYEYDYDGNAWNGMAIHQIQVMYMRTADVLKEFDSIEEAEKYAEEMRKHPDYKDDADYVRVITNGLKPNAYPSTNKAAIKGRDLNHDGSILRNVVDVGYLGEGKIIADDYIIYGSNQVKSADNIGLYSRENNDVYADEDIEDYEFTPEEQNILDAAPRDKQGRLLAPNGKVSNLNPKQYAQVRTKNFKNWFGDWINDPKNASKVVDENGEPLVVYHQGNSDITEFRPDGYNNIYFGDLITASSYGGTEYAVFLNIRKPLIVEGNGRDINDVTLDYTNRQYTRITGIEHHKYGTDGAIYKNVKDVGTSIYDFDYETIDRFWNEYEAQGYGTVYSIQNPNQVKSATDNNGEFSTTNNDINKDEFDNKTAVRLKRKPAGWSSFKYGDIIARLPKNIRDRIADNIARHRPKGSRNMPRQHEAISTLFGEEATSTTALDALDAVIENTQNDELRELAQFLKDNLGDIGYITLHLNEDIDGRGIYHDSNTPYIDIHPQTAGAETMQDGLESMAGTIVHEIAHAITVNAINSSESLRKEIGEIMHQLQSYAEQNGITDRIYALKNEKEFIAEFMSKPLLRESLKMMPYKETNFFKKIFNFIKKALGFNTNVTLFDKADKILDKILNAQLSEVVDSLAQDHIRDEFDDVEKAPGHRSVAEKVRQRTLKYNKEHINFDRITHTYFYDGVPTDSTVTRYLKDGKIIKREEEEEDEVLSDNIGYKEVSTKIGDSNDDISRDYFSDEKYEGTKVKDEYPNMDSEDIKEAKKGLAKFKKELDKRYGEGKYTVIVDEEALRYVGQITDKEGNTGTLGGTLDMMVIYNDGNSYDIYDFKTKRANLGSEFRPDQKRGYTAQVSAYSDMVEAHHPELRGKLGNLYLAKSDVEYPTPNGSERNERGITTYRLMKNGQIGVFKGGRTVPIQEARHVNIPYKTPYKAPVYSETIEVKYSKQLDVTSMEQPAPIVTSKDAYSNDQFPDTPTPIKRKYKGKLIYVQSGAGKSTIADNINVIDSDFLLAQILKVPTAIAGTAFQLLGKAEKIEIGKLYRKAIRDAVAEGKTVLTANNRMLDEADVIIFNESAEISNQRTGALDRTNPYRNNSYAEESLKQIEQAVKKGKEAHALDADTYAADVLLTNPEFNQYAERVKQYDTLEQLLEDFMGNFDITFEDFQQSGFSIELLKRVIRVKDASEISEATGTMIAFMMQWNGHVKSIIADMAVKDGVIEEDEIYNDNNTVNTKAYADLNKTKYYNLIGKSIADELKYQFESVKQGKGFDNFPVSRNIIGKIRDIIKKFFEKVLPNRTIIDELANFSRYVASNVLKNNESLIKANVLKPGDEAAGMVEQVRLKQTLDENPYEADIIQRLSGRGIILAGSTAMAEQITVYRPKENQLHDLDFNTTFKSKKELDEVLDEEFENISHIRTINNPGSTTETYVTLNVPFVIKQVDGIAVTRLEDLKGNYLGSMQGNNLTLEEGVQGKILDFFITGQEILPIAFDYNGTTIMLTPYTMAMQNKLMYGRVKDVWDYNRAKKMPLADAEGNKTRETRLKKQMNLTEQFIQDQVSLSDQINNILGNEKIKMSEVREIAEQIAWWVTDHITELQQNPDMAREIYGDSVARLNTAEASRLDIVKTIGVGTMLSKAQEYFRGLTDTRSAENRARGLKLSTVRKARLINENWNAFIRFAADVFPSIEKFSLSINNDGNLAVNDNIDPSSMDDFNDSREADEIAEIVASVMESWQVDDRTREITSRMSELVKLRLQQLYMLEDNGRKDEDGNPVYDRVKSEFGIDKRIKKEDAARTLLSWIGGSLTLTDMVDKLKEKQAANPWVSQLVDILEDTSGKEADFRAQFFGVFSLPFQLYGKVKRTKNTYHTMTLNKEPFLKTVTNSINALFKIGEHPMFTLKGVNEKVFDELCEVNTALLDARKKKLSQIDKEKLSKDISYAANVLGFSIAPDAVRSILSKKTIKAMSKALDDLTDTVNDNLNDPDYNPFEYNQEGGTYIGTDLKKFLRPMVSQFEDSAVASIFDNGKMYQSYVTPSYMTKLMRKFALKGERFTDFIEDEYGQFEWFKENTGDIETGWVEGSWLQEMVTDDEAREVFDHKVQLSFDKSNYMKDMLDTEYALSILTEYFDAKPKKGQSRVPTWFRVAMLSNKPSSEFIKFFSERGDNYRKTLTNKLLGVFNQEVKRIQTVLIRNYDKKDSRFIKNFDTRGRTFCFLDFMNDYLDLGNKDKGDKAGSKRSTELGKLLNRKLKSMEKLSDSDEAHLNKLVSEAIFETMSKKAERQLEEWKEQGIVEGAKKVSNIGRTEAEILENLENFFWNDFFASTQIMQLTITDKAYYKDAEDEQKRFAQIHSPGTRAFVDATDYEGNPILDDEKKLRTFYLKDFSGEDFKSNILENLEVVFDRKIQMAAKENKKQWKALKENILRQFREDINVTDAQGYSCPTSYRKKAFLFGKWSTEAEAIYQKLKSGEYEFADLETAFQPLKPFVYTQMSKDAVVENNEVSEDKKVEVPMSKLKVAVQNKNSEYLLIMADALLRGENTGRPNLLRAIYDIMEESAEADITKGIDTVQFESTVKSGLTGVIDLSEFAKMEEGGEKAAKEYMKSLIYAEDGYNSDYVHEIAAEDYCIQQEIPEHYRGHEAQWGSQIRGSICSDLETVDHEGNPVTYKAEVNGEIKELSAREFRQEFERVAAENVAESLNDLSRELKLDVLDRKDRNVALAKILQREILSSPRYGVDMYIACSLDKNGEFRIPLSDPIQSKRIEQLVNSIIKNRVNKQKISGGPLVQVSSFGLSRELNIRFKDKKTGKLLRTRSEYEESVKNVKNAESYEDYIKNNQGGIAYYEVFAPISSNEMFERFKNPDGTIDVAAIKEVAPEMLDLIGYRIPTEDKYSMAPLRIVGFMPKEAGDALMMPQDITLITGSDFDIDKFNIMMKTVRIKERPYKEINDLLFKDTLSRFKKTEGRNPTEEELHKISASIREFLTKKGDSDLSDPLNARLWKLYKRHAYKVVKAKNGRDYRNNKLFDMSLEVLTHESTADKILNPGGFDPQKRMGYLIEAYRRNSGISYDKLESMSIPELKDLCYTNKNLCYIGDHIQFYKQNSAAGSILGMFAVHKVSHAILEGDGYLLNVDGLLKLEGGTFTVAGMPFGGNMEIDPGKDRNNMLIGKSLGSLVGSAADAVKDPVLNLMNINATTANVLNALVRLGMPFDDAALFLSQKAITDVLGSYSKGTITRRRGFSKVITEKINKLKEDHKGIASSKLVSEELTKEELIKGLRADTMTPEIEYKVLNTMLKFQAISSALKGPTYATRFNSVVSAVGPLVIDNLITEYKMSQFSEHIFEKDGKTRVTFDSILNSHPILGQFASAYNIAKTALKDMPSNGRGFRNILESMQPSMADAIYNDRALLGQLSDFYQSYLMVASGAIDFKDADYYINEFPKEFNNENYKEKYADNLLIRSIYLDIDKNTDRVFLKVNTTGLRQDEKTLFSNAWIDLHRTDPELSIKLFKYNFFRGGIGFNPKTFMSLVPSYVKERIPLYNSTYTNIPPVLSETVIDQFVRNNWHKNSLVPKMEESNKLILSEDGSHVTVTDFNKVMDLKDTPYIKMEVDGEYALFKMTDMVEDIIEEGDMTALKYTRIDPLGGLRGEFLEISTEDIQESLDRDRKGIRNFEEDDSESSDSEEEGLKNLDKNKGFEDDPNALDSFTGELSEDQAEKGAGLYFYLTSEGDAEAASEARNKWDNTSKRMKEHMRNEVKDSIKEVFDKNNIKYDEKGIEKIVERFC